MATYLVVGGWTYLPSIYLSSPYGRQEELQTEELFREPYDRDS